MLMLEDLKKRSALSHDLSRIIAQNNYHVLIHNGRIFSGEKPAMNDAVFINSDLVFVGANHSNIIGPLFALEVNESVNLAILKEYLTYSDIINESSRRIAFEDELTALAVIISVFYPKIFKIRLPNEIAEFNNVECSVKHSFNGNYLNIKNRQSK